MGKTFADFKERISKFHSNRKLKYSLCGLLAFGSVLPCGLAAWMYFKKPEVKTPEVYTQTPVTITQETTLTPTPTPRPTIEYHLICNSEQGLVLEVDFLGRYENHTLAAKVLRDNMIVDSFIRDDAKELDESGMAPYDLTDPKYGLGDEFKVELFLYDPEGHFVDKYTSPKLSLEELCLAPTLTATPVKPTTTPTPQVLKLSLPENPYDAYWVACNDPNVPNFMLGMRFERVADLVEQDYTLHSSVIGQDGLTHDKTLDEWLQIGLFPQYAGQYVTIASWGESPHGKRTNVMEHIYRMPLCREPREQEPGNPPEREENPTEPARS